MGSLGESFDGGTHCTSHRDCPETDLCYIYTVGTHREAFCRKADEACTDYLCEAGSNCVVALTSPAIVACGRDVK